MRISSISWEETEQREKGLWAGEELGMRDKRMTHTCGSPHQRGCVLVQQRGVLGVHGELERETERVDTRQKGVCGCSNRDVCVCGVGWSVGGVRY